MNNKLSTWTLGIINMMFKIMWLYYFVDIYIYAWMRTKLQVGRNCMIAESYSSIEGRLRHLMGKV